MTKEHFHEICKAMNRADKDSSVVIVAMYIAMDHCEEPATIEQYGTIACESLKQLKEQLR